MAISITASNITASSALLTATWSGYTPDTFKGYVSLIECNEIQVATRQYTSDTNISGTSSGLDPNKEYEAKVTLWHKTGTVSNTVKFTTSQITVGTPTIGSISVSGKTATINYTPGTNTYGVEFHILNGADFYAYSSPTTNTFDTYGTTYYIKARGYSSGGVYSAWTGYTSLTTGAAPLVAGVPTIGIINIDGKTASINYTKGANNDGVEFESTSGEAFTTSSSPVSATFPNYSTTYSIRARGYNNNGSYSAWTGYKTLTTGAVPLVAGIPTNISSNVSPNTKTVTISFTKGANNTYVVATIYDSGYNVIDTAISYGTSISYEAPTYNTSYKYTLKGYYSSTNTSDTTSYHSFTTGVAPSTRPSNWSWTTNIYANAPMLTAKITEGVYYAYVIPASEWNNFTTKINAFLAYKKLSLATFTSVSSGTNFTSVILNQAVYNINRMLTDNYISYGSDITAALFIYMRDRLNSIQ